MLEYNSYGVDVRSSAALTQDVASPQKLTGREYEVLALLAVGHPMKQIAYRLGITYRTVTFHKYRMMERLGIRTNAGLVHYAIRNGVLERVGPAINCAAAT
jgi:DNA-binding CsgD family transcriptional regulator